MGGRGQGGPGRGKCLCQCPEAAGKMTMLHKEESSVGLVNPKQGQTAVEDEVRKTSERQALFPFSEPRIDSEPFHFYFNFLFCFGV